jgi:hypothetical protein
MHCQNNMCKEMIQKEYNVLVNSLLFGDKTLPRFKAGTEKDW